MILDENKSLLAALIKVAKADGNVDFQENMNIMLIRQRMNISNEDFKYILENVDRLDVRAPYTQTEKVDHMYRILTMMKMDMNANDEELAICKEIIKDFGYKEEKAVELVDYMANNVHRFVKFEEFEKLMAN